MESWESLMESKYIDHSLKQYIEIKGVVKGRVAEMWSDAFAVLVESNLVYFLKDAQYIAPMSIVVGEDESFSTKSVAINDEVVFDSEKIIVGYNKLKISTVGAEVIVHSCEDFEKSGSVELLEHNLTVLEDCIYSNGKHEGIAPLVFKIGDYVVGYENYLDVEIHNNLYTTLVFDRMINFMNKLMRGEIDEIWKYSGEIIGLGPGITPSSNDFLSGFMNTLVYGASFFELCTSKVYRFNEELLLSLDYDRDRISHYIMKSSIYGKTQKIVAEVISGVFSVEDEELFRSKLRALINFGDITGTDILCGIYMGYRTLQSKSFREKLV